MEQYRKEILIRNIGLKIIDYLFHNGKEISKEDILKDLCLNRHYLLKSEIIEVIDEAPISDEDYQIAKCYYLEKGENAEQTASKLGYDVRTIKSHIESMSPILCETLCKMVL